MQQKTNDAPPGKRKRSKYVFLEEVFLCTCWIDKNRNKSFNGKAEKVLREWEDAREKGKKDRNRRVTKCGIGIKKKESALKCAPMIMT